MKAKLLFRFLCLFLILIVNCKRSEDRAKQLKPEVQISHQDFEEQLIHAIKISDSAHVAELIQRNRYKIGSGFDHYAHSFWKNKITGDDKEAAQNLAIAQWLADSYDDFFKSDYFQKRLELFKNWSNDQILKKLQADSLREQAEKLFESYEFENSQQLNQQALKTYQQLDDKENEARSLNAIGLCQLRLTNFPSAEQYLKQSLKINRELGLKHGIIDNLDNLGNLNKQQLNFLDAEKLFQVALEIAEEIDLENSVGKQWCNLGDTYRKMEQHEQASDCLTKAMEIAQRSNDLDLQANTLLRFGSLYLDQSKLKQSIETWEQGLAISRQIKDRRLEGSFLGNVSIAYRNIGKYDDALKLLRLALILNKDTRNYWAEGLTLREIGADLYYQGLPDSAVFYWHQSFEVYRNIPDTSMMGMLLGFIGVYHKNKGQPYEALKYYQQALYLARKTGNEREASNILCNMANVYGDLLAEYGKDANLLREALEIKKRLGEVHYAAVILGNLGICYKNQGDYQKALEHFFDALKIGRETRHKAGAAKNLSDIAATYLDLGEYQQAATYFQEALDIFREIGEKKPQVEALMNLGSNYLNLDNSDSAFACCHLALDLAKEIGHAEFEGSACFYLGEGYRRKGDNQKALEFYGKSLELSNKTNDLRKQGELSTAMGDVTYDMQDYSKAVLHYSKGLQIGQKIGSPEGIWRAHYGMGKVLEKQGKNNEAEKSYTQAIQTIESMRTKLTAQTLRESFMEDKIKVYHSMINLLLKSGREDDAYKYLERSKARSLLDILSTGHINITEGITPERSERKKQLEWKYNKFQQDLFDKYSKSEKDDKLIASLEDSLKQVRHDHEQLLQEIELYHPRYASLTGISEPLNLKQVQERVLQSGTLLVEYLVGENHTIIWIIGKNSFVHGRLDLKGKDLEKMVTDLLQPFREVKAGKIKNLANVGFDLKLAGQLYQQIFLPAEKYLQKDSHLIIVPDGILHYLPFEALVTEIEKKEFDRNIIFSRYETAHYLVEKYAISYSSSASVLDPKLFSSDKKAKQEGQLLAFGNPDFSRAREAVRLAKEKEAEALPNYPVLASISTRGGCYNQLPRAEDEVKVIAEILKPSLLYIGKDAKEENFKEQSSNFANIHLATHCVVEETQPMYSRIVFAQDDDPTEDGFLHTYEVFNLKLNADLVTLGACETGLGKLSRGEGLIGLTRAFMYAGAPSVIVSLWSVNESTAELMKLFYQNLKEGVTKVEALRQAKLKLIQSNGRFGDGQKFSLAHPYLWAPFVLVGDWK